MTILSLVYWFSQYSSKDAMRLISTEIRCGFDTPLWRPGRIASTYQKASFGNAPKTSNSANLSRAKHNKSSPRSRSSSALDGCRSTIPANTPNATIFVGQRFSSLL
jgi:hypothetical protein